jgi:hypothetical protein
LSPSKQPGRLASAASPFRRAIPARLVVGAMPRLPRLAIKRQTAGSSGLLSLACLAWLLNAKPNSRAVLPASPEAQASSFVVGVRSWLFIRRCLTPQSRGQSAASRTLPLTSNVSPPPRSPREAVVEQSLSALLPALNTNSRDFQRWPQQALPAASTATAAQLVPSFAAQQACAAGPSKSGLPHTPAALSLSPRRPPCRPRQYTRLRCVGASRGQGRVGAGSRPASFKVGSRSSFSSWLLVAPARLSASNARQAKPAEMHWPAVGRLASSRPRANPSIKRTCLRQAAYFER